VKATLFWLLLTASTVIAEQPTWIMDAGKTLRLDTSTEPKRLLDSSDSVVVEFPVAEDVRGAVVSERHTCLLLLVSIERLSERRPDRRSFDYGYLVRISSGPGGWRVTRLLDHAAPPMNELHRTVSELGAVSDDGKTALLKYAEANRQKAPYTMDYVWQTWDLEAPKVIGTGLRLEHGKR